jgi:Domain of unknown function (DUF4340)
MAMKARGLLIAALVLAALLGVLYWSNRHGPTADTTVKASPEAAPKILSFNQDDVTSLTFHRQDGHTLQLSRNTSGVWQIASPEVLAADQEAVSGVLSALSSLNAERLLEDKASNLAAYGLLAPPLEIDAILKNNKTERLLIGDQTPSGNASYAMLAGDPRLFTIASYNKSSLDKTADDLRDKRLLTADFDKVSQMELITKKPGKTEDITFARDKDAWQILKPGPFRAEGSRVEDLIRSLKEAKIQTGSASDDSKNAKAFKSAVPFAIAKISGASGTQELEVRRVKDDYYAKSTVTSGAYQVPASVGTSLDKTLDDFRNKKLFDFGYTDPNKIEIHDGPKAYFLTRSGSDWWGPDGKKREPSSVEALLGNLRDLAATAFPESGFATPALELIVTSNDGKRVERVSVAKQGSAYAAKREGEPGLYELASGAVQQLQESAENVKPASSPTK